jgi:hypothetical protein
MGEYWKPVNLTRREYIHPHRANCGLKLMEWNYAGSPVRKLMKAHWPPTDDVRALSDYGGEMQLYGSSGPEVSPEYCDLESDFVDISSRLA